MISDCKDTKKTPKNKEKVKKKRLFCRFVLKKPYLCP